MSISLQDLQAQDDTYAQRVKHQPKEQKPEPPKGLQIFMQTLTGSVPDSVLLAAIRAADTMDIAPLKGWGHMYAHVRDAVVAFRGEYTPSPENDAIARLCVPLLGYARVLNYLQGIAAHAQRMVDSGKKPSQSTRFADVHALGERTQHAFSDALGHAGHHLHIAYVNFIAGTLSESELDAEIGKHTKPVQAALLTGAASILKDGLRGTRAAIDSGATTTDDLMPPVPTLQPHDSEYGHGVHLREHPDGGYSVVAPGAPETPERAEEGSES